MKKSNQNKMSCRALAKALGRSPSHICRVMRGERSSLRLAAKLRERGISVRRCASAKAK